MTNFYFVPIISGMEMFSLNSSCVAKIGYENGTLFVRFHNNPKLYSLPKVPYSLFTQFLNASSHGEFWNLHLRGKFK
jgi:hypothetical protein